MFHGHMMWIAPSLHSMLHPLKMDWDGSSLLAISFFGGVIEMG
jgi:hypothetical protein